MGKTSFQMNCSSYVIQAWTECHSYDTMMISFLYLLTGVIHTGRRSLWSLDPGRRSLSNTYLRLSRYSRWDNFDNYQKLYFHETSLHCLQKKCLFDKTSLRNQRVPLPHLQFPSAWQRRLWIAKAWPCRSWHSSSWILPSVPRWDALLILIWSQRSDDSWSPCPWIVDGCK